MKKLYLPIAFILFSLKGVCQQYFYTLNQFAPQLYNPAVVGTDNDAGISFLNRRTQVAPTLSYQNNAVNGEYPFINNKSGKRYGGIGLSFLEKNSGGDNSLKTAEFSLSLAYNLPIAKNQFISFGLQPGYYNKRISFENITTGSQWVASEFRFDASADPGETFPETRVSYFGFNGGVLWYLEDESGKGQKAFIGASAYNLNKPSDSFFGKTARIPVSFLFQIGGVVFQKKRIQISPQLQYQLGNNKSSVNLLASTRLFFTNENPYDIIKSGSIEILNKFDLKKDFSTGIAFHQPGFSIGFNYNFPLVVKSSDLYFQNAFEVGIKIKRTMWKPKTTTIVIENNPVEPKRNFDFSNPQPVNTQPVQTKKEVEVVQEKIEEYSKVKSAHIQLQLEKDFKFPYGRTELDSEAKAFLDEIYSLLTGNPEYKLEVIGHTDNVGKSFVNYRLSLGRAQAVTDYLKEKGIKEDRLKFTGKGDTEPVAPNDTEENKSRNRRVQFVIYVNR